MKAKKVLQVLAGFFAVALLISFDPSVLSEFNKPKFIPEIKLFDLSNRDITKRLTDHCSKVIVGYSDKKLEEETMKMLKEMYTRSFKKDYSEKLALLQLEFLVLQICWAEKSKKTDGEIWNLVLLIWYESLADYWQLLSSITGSQKGRLAGKLSIIFMEEEIWCRAMGLKLFSEGIKNSNRPGKVDI